MSELFIETHYLDGGKGPRADVVVVTLSRLRKLITDVLGPTSAHDVMEAIYEEAEDLR